MLYGLGRLDRHNETNTNVGVHIMKLMSTLVVDISFIMSTQTVVIMFIISTVDINFIISSA